MFAALFAFSMNNANALTEEECDVTPGMNWDGAACMDADAATDAAEPSNGHIAYKYEGKKEYTSQVYGGHRVVGDVKDHFAIAKPIVKREINQNLLGIEAKCSSDDGYLFETRGYLKTDFGDHCWCRLETDKKTSRWVKAVGYPNSSVAPCVERCPGRCAIEVAGKYASEFRSIAYQSLDIDSRNLPSCDNATDGVCMCDIPGHDNLITNREQCERKS